MEITKAFAYIIPIPSLEHLYTRHFCNRHLTEGFKDKWTLPDAFKIYFIIINDFIIINNFIIYFINYLGILEHIFI